MKSPAQTQPPEPKSPQPSQNRPSRPVGRPNPKKSRAKGASSAQGTQTAGPATGQTPLLETQEQNRGLTVNLSEGQISWIAEISASVLRNNQLRKTPTDWRKLPHWWLHNAPKEIPLNRPALEDLTYDLRLATEVLSALAGATPVSARKWATSRK